MSSPPSNPTYAAYLIAETSLGPQDHHYIFLETAEEGPLTGHRFHVIGNIQEGMTFNHRFCIKPEDEPVFLSKTRIGSVSVQDYEAGRVLSICEEIEVPKKQFQGAKRLFPKEKLRRCQEWAADAVALLRERGVLKEAGDGMNNDEIF
ncbi:uncharacterized protein DSM5745_10531 [Aspergillus mulundensis]|uniref:Uncharacterized protein n=1 Tax=Aspergillus mulundensis TaxID=1810919 RepID=A0A3D8QJA1_9EURO|nr:Uncharacterized protein DSM5745_10531 [Aspergillus mulundensis]RDW61859.1 Uncharacterized protein DSM5745_10531 [Aspergillus mulundensis]